MGFWDKVKTFLGNEKPGEGEPKKDDAPPAVKGPATPASSGGAKPAQSAKNAAAPPPVATFTTTQPVITPAPAPATGAKKGKPKDPYDASGILGLSAEELRKRALKINPYKTAWIGRVDTIPPQSDERTAIIDRGLILRGLLSEAQIAEIHRIGDLWLRHREVTSLAESVAKQKASEVIEELRRQKAERKAEKKRLAAERKQKRAEEIARRRAEDIIYLGRGVSAGLGDRRSHIEALGERGLPLLSTPADVAKALQIPVPRLRWLCFHSEAVEKPHYVYFEVPKRSGGTRLLSAPHEALAKAQQWILHNILEKLPVEDPAHGFVKGRSTVTNARPHLGQQVVVNLDLSDFFPTVTFLRVRGFFEKIGYSPAVATIFALLCTEPPRRRVVYDGQPYWVAVGTRGLPQGACTSPAISNGVSRKLDRRLTGMSKKMGYTYTRYADDLTFSAPAPAGEDGDKARNDIGILLARVRHIVQEEGFAINPKKGRVQHAGGRQSVTGIVVNDKLSVPREEVRKLRAILHAAKTTGLAAQNREGIPHFEAYVRGKVAYLHMVDPERAAPLLRALEALG
ncbi:reverse transcriptase family protein [Polyangium aurulentum]|uniref:reverse transcriptase family protein n=1 Tax=Polyangium aurulentum TaxID=2567896 RepID=UPI0010ADD03B|nr:reverse transcriptase family protein [Polyangium aurulentum]UQA58688.1 RNA-directed DNA polymerase [Polyangium aurulentum]